MPKKYQSKTSIPKWMTFLFASVAIIIMLVGISLVIIPADFIGSLGTLFFTFGFFILWAMIYESFIKKTVWGMLIVDDRIIWNTMKGIEYIKISELKKVIVPKFDDYAAIKLILKDGNLKIIDRDNCKNVENAINQIKTFSNDISFERATL